MSRHDSVARWAGTVLDLADSAGPVPLAGDDEWAALPPSDPRKFAAVIRAALAWLADGADDALRARLADEIELADLAVRYRVSGASRDVSAALADLHPDAARRVTHAELQRRRDGLLRPELLDLDAEAGVYRGWHERQERLAERADRLGIVDLDVRSPGWNVRAGIRARGLRLEGEPS